MMSSTRCVDRDASFRFALADAGDSLEDANFAMDSANQAILTLTGEEVSMYDPGPR